MRTGNRGHAPISRLGESPTTDHARAEMSPPVGSPTIDPARAGTSGGRDRRRSTAPRSADVGLTSEIGNTGRVVL
jgi:hypothetical protein